MAEGSGPGGKRWLGAVEGYYGPPLEHQERLDLIEWLSRHRYNSYAYGPKDDPFHRDRWREPYPEERHAEMEELVATGDKFGVSVALGISPGLDWGTGDEIHLVEKLSRFRELGAKVLAVAWDDVPGGGAELGTIHGSAVAHAIHEVGDDLLWFTVPTDYATPRATEYLKAFVDRLPENVEVAWTGPSVVSPKVTGADASALATELGRPLLFGENFPVNDAAMGGVLHIGPYPDRSADLVDETTGVFCNFMSLPLASRVGLAVAARFWTEPDVDRVEAWMQVLEEFPGLAPLAKASYSWIDPPGPHPELSSWAESGDPRLREYLQAGCREGLDAALAAEIEPWLDQWERESQAMQAALETLTHPHPRPIELSFITAFMWDRARHSREQLFGIRWAYYPVTSRIGESWVAAPEALVVGENLTDRLCRLALSGS
jgi:hypothetical protein